MFVMLFPIIDTFVSAWQLKKVKGAISVKEVANIVAFVRF
jgi:hypothetical protein